MNQDQINSLQGICERISLDRIERKLNSHDIAAMPKLVKPLLGKMMPDAIVQPQSEEELASVVKWANGQRIPLTPRGKATSGYGGVLPIKGGIVVDFYYMKTVEKIDKEALLVTVQPGISFEQLDRKLKKEGLTLKMYPSSYPSATVGGWLAQGGAGFGSFEYGFFKQIVKSVRIVLPDGSVKELKGDDIQIAADAEGITGMISQVTLEIMENEPMEIVSIGCKQSPCFQGFLEELLEKKLPIWSILFINPTMAKLKNQAPVQMHHGHPVEEHVELPEEYITTITFRKSKSEEIHHALKNLKCENTRILSDEIAQHEWKNRFKLMTVKRLGPSFVPAEVIVPVKNIAAALDDIEKKVGLPIVKEGVIIREGRNKEPEVVILGFIPSDERKFSYNFAFALSLTVFRIAEKHGGRGYSTGLYFTAKANSIHGKEEIKAIQDFKNRTDPNKIMNPGKVVGKGILPTFLSVASTFEPVARLFGNSVQVEIGERPTVEKKGIPADVVWYAYACSQCGYCVDECDQFYGRGWESQSPRGKWYWLREYLEGREKWNQQMVDTFLVCTTCELCNNRCSAALPIEQSWMKIRGQIIQEENRMTIPSFEMMAEATLSEGDIWAGYRKDRDKWMPEEFKEKHGPSHKSKNVYFAGCTASYVEEDIAIASTRILDEAGVDFSYLGKAENCCGTPMLVSGKWDVFAEVVRRNVSAIKGNGADTVITSCPACDMMWRHVYPTWAKKLGLDYNITTKHYSEVVTEQIEKGAFKFPENDLEKQKVTWHDSCHMGRVSKIYDAPRKMIQSIPNVEFVEMDHNHEEAHCCGSVLTLIKEPDIAEVIGYSRLDEAVEVGAEKMIAACPCCEFQFRVTQEKTQQPVEIVDLASFAAKALGYELPDPHPEVQAQWKVFESMIALMTPQGFADLMGTMWPELIDAMPLGMGSMMRFMGKNVPGMLNLMKPFFPVLFPILLPQMMPKVMSTMLDRVGNQIPMPDYMLEQMPTLMPKVMDSLMPHMIGDLVPLVTDPMISYLKTNGNK